MKVIGWLSEREGLRESSGDSVKVIGWLSEREGRLASVGTGGVYLVGNGREQKKNWSLKNLSLTAHQRRGACKESVPESCGTLREPCRDVAGTRCNLRQNY